MIGQDVFDALLTIAIWLTIFFVGGCLALVTAFLYRWTIETVQSRRVRARRDRRGGYLR